MELKERLIYVVSIIILIMTLLATCESTRQTEQTYIEDRELFTQKRNNDSSLIARQALTIVSQANDIKELKELAIKEPELIIRTQIKNVVKTEIQLDTVMIESKPYLKLPKDFYKKDKWYTIGGTINRIGTLQIDSLVSFANLTYAIADTSRSGLWNRLNKRRDKVLSLKIDNPNMRITGMSNIYIQEHKKWWQTTGAKIGIGFILGLGVVAAVN